MAGAGHTVQAIGARRLARSPTARHPWRGFKQRTGRDCCTSCARRSGAVCMSRVPARPKPGEHPARRYARRTSITSPTRPLGSIRPNFMRANLPAAREPRIFSPTRRTVLTSNTGVPGFWQRTSRAREFSIWAAARRPMRKLCAAIPTRRSSAGWISTRPVWHWPRRFTIRRSASTSARSCHFRTTTSTQYSRAMYSGISSSATRTR